MLRLLHVLKGHLAIAILLAILVASCTHHQPVVEQSLNEGWTLTGDTLDIKALPVAVPAVVHQNLYEAGFKVVGIEIVFVPTFKSVLVKVYPSNKSASSGTSV